MKFIKSCGKESVVLQGNGMERNVKIEGNRGVNQVQFGFISLTL